LINRAWADIRRQNLWSFLLFDANWTSPAAIATGTVTTTQGSNTVTVSTAAAAAINAAATYPTPVTQRQFRMGVGTIYNVWGWDTVSTLTLDRPMQESSVTNGGYLLYQIYYPVPMQDFLVFFSVRDMVSNIPLRGNKTRAMLDETDPQRLTYYLPTDYVPYTQDNNPASPTYGWLMEELWGSPLSQLTYQLYGCRRGTPLANPTDILPFAVGEDCVLALSRKYAYEWAEANKGDNPRNSGPDFRFLIGEAKGDYDRLFREYRRDDRERADSWFQIHHLGLFGKGWGYYNTLAGVANPGAIQ